MLGVPQPAEASAARKEPTAAGAIRRELKRVRKFRRKQRFDDQDRLHALRIACKRLRYVCEFFRHEYPDELNDLIQLIVALQDALGAMRDAHVHAEWLRAPLREHYRDVPVRMALLHVARALRQQQRQEYREFRRLWKSFTAKKYQRKIKHGVSLDEDRG